MSRMNRGRERGKALRWASAAYNLAAWRKKEVTPSHRVCRSSTGFVFS